MSVGRTHILLQSYVCIFAHLFSMRCPPFGFEMMIIKFTATAAHLLIYYGNRLDVLACFICVFSKMMCSSRTQASLKNIAQGLLSGSSNSSSSVIYRRHQQHLLQQQNKAATTLIWSQQKVNSSIFSEEIAHPHQQRENVPGRRQSWRIRN